MAELLIGIIFLFGTIIGSFLNVVLYRMHTGKSLSGRSHCLSCGTPLRWFELFPLLSYLVLRGTCRTCAAYIPPRYWLVEFTTGLLFVLAYYAITDWVVLISSFCVLAVLILIVVYDIRHTIIPNELTALVLGVAIFIAGYEYYVTSDYMVVVARVVAGVGAAGFFGLLWGVSKGRWLGFGDVKLIFPLAMLVSFPLVFSLVVFSFWIGAIISLTLMAWHWLQTRGQVGLQPVGTQLTMKSEIPFAPFLVAAFMVTYLWHINVLSLFHYVSVF